MITVNFLPEKNGKNRQMKCVLVAIEDGEVKKVVGVNKKSKRINGDILIVFGPPTSRPELLIPYHPIIDGNHTKSDKYYAFATPCGIIEYVQYVPSKSTSLVLPPKPARYCFMINKETFEKLKISTGDIFSIGG